MRLFFTRGPGFFGSLSQRLVFLALVVASFGLQARPVGVPADSIAGVHPPIITGSKATDATPVYPATGWGRGTVQPMAALLLSITETRLRLAARTAYLATEAHQYGAYVSAAAQTDRDTAAGLFNFLDSRGGYVDSLGAQHLTVLPVGIKKDLPNGNGSVEIGILKARFLPDRALLTVFVRLKIPTPNSSVTERELFFGADDVVFTRDGGLSSDFTLTLLGDFVQPLDNMILRIKGGLDRRTGATSQLTYATISCGGLAGLGITAEVLFPRSMLVPINATSGAVEGGQITARFSVTAPSFSDLLAEATIDRPFAVAGYEKFGFEVVGIKLDLSDTRNSPGVVFPSDYFSQPANALPGGETSGTALTQWRGVYIQHFGLILPSEFKSASGGSPLRIMADNLLYDRNGVSGIVGVHRSSDPYALTASGWAMSLTDFQLAFEKNKLKGGALGGFLSLPIAPDKPVRYDGIIDDKSNYSLHLSNLSTINISMWRATAELEPNSRIDLLVEGGVFRPRAVLNGKLGIYMSTTGTAESSATARISFSGVFFEQLTLQTVSPYISATRFGYEGEGKLAGFPVTVNSIGAVFVGDTVGLRFNLSVNLMKGHFSGETDFTLVGQIDRSAAVHRWNYRNFFINQICIAGTATAFTLKGCAAFYRGDAIYGDGFKGDIYFATKEPAKIEVFAKAQFGYKDFRYWYVDAAVAFPKPIPIAGPVMIDAIALGAYHNMRPTGISVGTLKVALYRPDLSIGLGFKAAAGLLAVKRDLVQGSLGLELTFGRETNGYPLNSIGLYGDAVVMGPQDEGDQLKVSRLVNSQASIYLLSASKPAQESLTQADVTRKAAQEYSTTPPGPGGSISGRLAMLYDRPNQTVQAQANVYINIANVVKGNSDGRVPYLAGTLNFYSGPSKWYLYVGSVKVPNRVVIDLGVKLSSSSYFMVGSGIDSQLPPIPDRVKRNLFDNGQAAPRAQRDTTEQRALQEGKGVAFGANMTFDAGFDLGVVYGNLYATAGGDVLLRQYPAGYCSRPSVGSNGWYNRGQLYAFIQGNIGICPFFCFDVLSASAGAYVGGGFPNPSGIEGRAGIEVNVIGFHKQVNIDLNRGTICR